MNQLLSSKIRLYKRATFRHDFHNVTLIFFFFSFDLTWLFLIQCRMKIRTPYNTNIIMDDNSFLLLFCFKYNMMTIKEIFTEQSSY